MESKLDIDELLAQRAAIASIQSDLLNTLQGRNYKVVRRYQEVPGIALEVGADGFGGAGKITDRHECLARSPDG